MKNVLVWLSKAACDCLGFTRANEVRLRAELPGAEVCMCRDERDVLAHLPAADAALVWRFDRTWLHRASRLRFVSTPAAGHEGVDLPPSAAVQVHHGTFHGRFMGETVLGMMLAACRGLLRTAWVQDQVLWPRDAVGQYSRSLRGAHLVILGFGHIGEWVGRYAKHLGVRITGVKRRIGPSVPAYFDAADVLVTIDELDAVLPAADHLVLCLPAGADTDRMLDRHRIGRLPSHAWIYNVGRGNAIDEAALARALESDAIAGACLDVFEQEPLPADSPLPTAPHILRMPHISAFSPTYMDAYLDDVLPLLREPAPM